jgi:transposase
MFSYRICPEERVPRNHPLRLIKADVEQILAEMSPDFQAYYSKTGRPSIPPETIMKATLLIALFSIRSDRQFCEQLDYNILYRWFLDMSMDESSFDHSCFCKLRRRLKDEAIANKFFGKVVDLARKRGLLSDEHFTVDGTLIEAWASQKSFRPNDDSGDKPDDKGDRNFRGEKRTNDTHSSTTDPEAKMMRKGPGKEAKLSYGAHCLMENRNGLVVGMLVTPATDTETSAAERLVADWLASGRTIESLGADKGYHTKAFVEYLRSLEIAPHIAMIAGRKTPGLDCRTTRHCGYKMSQVRRKIVEEIFGWAKVIGGIRKSRFVGRLKTSVATIFVSAAYNLLRMSRLAAA